MLSRKLTRLLTTPLARPLGAVAGVSGVGGCRIHPCRRVHRGLNGWLFNEPQTSQTSCKHLAVL